MPTDSGSLFHQMAMVGLVLLLLGLCLWALNRRGILHAGAVGRFRPRGKRLESLERLALGPQHSLHLVKIEGRTLVLGVSPHAVNLIETLSEHGQRTAGAAEAGAEESWAIGPLAAGKEIAR